MAPIITVSRNQIDPINGKVIPYPNNLTANKEFHGTVPEPAPVLAKAK